MFGSPLVPFSNMIYRLVFSITFLFQMWQSFFIAILFSTQLLTDWTNKHKNLIDFGWASNFVWFLLLLVTERKKMKLENFVSYVCSVLGERSCEKMVEICFSIAHWSADLKGKKVTPSISSSDTIRFVILLDQLEFSTYFAIEFSFMLNFENGTLNLLRFVKSR